VAVGSEGITSTVFASLLRVLGCEPQAKKVWYEGGFAFVVQMLGVIFHLDCDPMYVSVPEDKVEKAVSCIQLVRRDNWAPADICQSLLGILAFHGRILLAGRWHLPHTVRALAIACTQGAAPVTPAWKVELDWWTELLRSWNCTAILVPKIYTLWHQEPLHMPLTDANRALNKHSGAGGVFGVYYQHFTFTQEEVKHLTIM
jgi:hypothetical protein